MSQLPRGLRIHLAAGILVLQVHLVLAIISLFYINLWLIVVYIVLVDYLDYLVSKCDSEAARAKLNSLSDPTSIGFVFTREALSYRMIVSLSYRIVSYHIIPNLGKRKHKRQNIKREKRTVKK
jgi:hypothetical protein